MRIDDLHAAMLNWARWCHDDSAGLQCSISSIWRLLTIHGWGEHSEDAIPDAIDTQAAEATDYALRHIAAPHMVLLRKHYYSGKRQPELDLNAALRALGDWLDGGRHITIRLTTFSRKRQIRAGQFAP